MPKTPWEMAAVGNEFSDQTALFAWAAMARQFGPGAANDYLSYKTAGYAQREYGYKPEGDTCRSGSPYALPKLKWLHAIKNQGHGDRIRGARSKAEGVRAGVFDVFLPVPALGYGLQGSGFNGVYCGLYLELKQIKDGKPSDIQLEFQADMRAAGYAAEIVYGWEAARDCILKYL